MSKGRVYTYYEPGTCNSLCQVTGKKVKLHELRRRWDGLLVCAEAWHPQQPQDLPVSVLDEPVFPTSNSPEEDPTIDEEDLDFSVI